MPLNIYGEQTPENPSSITASPPADLGSNANPGGVPRYGLSVNGEQVVGAPPAPVQSTTSGALYGRTQIPAIIPDTQLSNAYNPSVTTGQNDVIGGYMSDLRTQQEQLQNLDNTFAQNYGNMPQYNPQEDYNRLFQTAGISDLYGQQTTLEGDLSKVRSAAQSLEDQFNNLSQDQEGQGGFANIVAGRQARLSKELGRRLQPLQRQEQLLVDRSNALTNRLKSVKDDIAQQISLGQQNYQNAVSQQDSKLKLFGLQRDAKSQEIADTRENIKMVQDQLNKQLELAQKNRLDPLEVIKTMLQVPEGISFELADGTKITGLKTEKPNVKQVSETDQNGQVTVVGINEQTGEILYKKNLGNIATPSAQVLKRNIAPGTPQPSNPTSNKNNKTSNEVSDSYKQLSPIAQSVVDGVITLQDLTPTQRAQIAPELNNYGYQAAPKLSSGQQTDMADMDTINQQIQSIYGYNKDGKLEGVGSFGRGSLYSLGAQLGFGGDEGKSVRAIVGNLRGTLAKLRGGTSFTAGEERLLNSYVPNINDAPAVLLNKLAQLELFIKNKKANLLSSTKPTITGTTGGSATDILNKYEVK